MGQAEAGAEAGRWWGARWGKRAGAEAEAANHPPTGYGSGWPDEVLSAVRQVVS